MLPDLDHGLLYLQDVLNAQLLESSSVRNEKHGDGSHAKVTTR